MNKRSVSYRRLVSDHWGYVRKAQCNAVIALSRSRLIVLNSIESSVPIPLFPLPYAEIYARDHRSRHPTLTPSRQPLPESVPARCAAIHPGLCTNLCAVIPGRSRPPRRCTGCLCAEICSSGSGPPSRRYPTRGRSGIASRGGRRVPRRSGGIGCVRQTYGVNRRGIGLVALPCAA